jgi:PAZ domain
MPALDFLGEFLKGALLTTDFQRKEFEREIKGLKVETTYGGTRRQRVTGVSRESAASSRFDHNGTSTTVVVYFRTQFKITLKHPELPCLKVS